MKTRYRHIHFEKDEHCDYWDVCSNKNNCSPPLGVIEWYPQRKQWCFDPNKHNYDVFSQNNLADIVDFIKQLKENL